MSHVMKSLTVGANGAMHPNPPPDPARDWPKDLAELLREGRRQAEQAAAHEAYVLAESRLALYESAHADIERPLWPCLRGPDDGLWESFTGTGTFEVGFCVPGACELRALYKHVPASHSMKPTWRRVPFLAKVAPDHFSPWAVLADGADCQRYHYAETLPEALLLAVELRQNPPSKPEPSKPPKPSPLTQGEILLDKLRDYILHLASPWGS